MASKNERELKVCALSGHNYKPVPSIRLMGQWLEAAGFHIGDKAAMDLIFLMIILAFALQSAPHGVFGILLIYSSELQAISNLQRGKKSSFI